MAGWSFDLLCAGCMASTEMHSAFCCIRNKTCGHKVRGNITGSGHWPIATKRKTGCLLKLKPNFKQPPNKTMMENRCKIANPNDVM
jgi:hypothetical protein